MGEVISGTAYGQRATLEISGDSLTWRARPVGELPENIATTVHDVSNSTWLEQRTSLPGLVLLGVGIVWTFTHGLVAGALAIAAGAALFAWRRSRPRRLLVLDLGNRRLVLTVDATSAPLARTLVRRIDGALDRGDALPLP